MRGSARNDFRTSHQYSNPGIHSRLLYKVIMAGAGGTPEVPSFLRQRQVGLDLCEFKICFGCILPFHTSQSYMRPCLKTNNKECLGYDSSCLTARFFIGSIFRVLVRCGCVGIECVVQEIIVQTRGSWFLMQAL